MNEPQMPVSAIETPAVIVYMDVLESNIARMSQLAREAGVRLRPHTKIHECPEIAKLQIAAGACGIEVGAIERALSAWPRRGSATSSSPTRSTAITNWPSCGGSSINRV